MSIHFKMAWRNIWRNRRRSFLTMLAIAFACALLVFMLSFQFGSYEAMLNSAIKIHTGYFQIQAEGYQDKNDIRLVVHNPEAVARILEDIPQVSAFTFRASAFSLASSEERTYGVAVSGIDPTKEAAVSSIKRLIREGEYLSEGDLDEALVGALLAKNLRVGIGDAITLLGQGRDGSVAATVVTVKGIFSSGQDDFDRSAVHIPLDYFQEVFFMRGAVHTVVGLTPSLWDLPKVVDAAVGRLSALNTDPPLVVLDWKELMPGLAQAIMIDLISALIFYMLLILVVAFSILNTFLMAIFERTREFGVLMAMGTTKERLTRLLMTESMIMTVLGIAGGILLGGLVTLYFQKHGISMGDSSELFRQFGISGRIYPRFTPLSAAIGPSLVLVITFLAALYPAFKVRKLRPVEALSYI
ncbi:MAG: ABC transporter permease [Desulfococcaceae bacterium]